MKYLVLVYTDQKANKMNKIWKQIHTKTEHKKCLQLSQKRGSSRSHKYIKTIEYNMKLFVVAVLFFMHYLTLKKS